MLARQLPQGLCERKKCGIVLLEKTSLFASLLLSNPHFPDLIFAEINVSVCVCFKVLMARGVVSVQVCTFALMLWVQPKRL